MGLWRLTYENTKTMSTQSSATHWGVNDGCLTHNETSAHYSQSYLFKAIAIHSVSHLEKCDIMLYKARGGSPLGLPTFIPSNRRQILDFPWTWPITCDCGSRKQWINSASFVIDTSSTLHRAHNQAEHRVFISRCLLSTAGTCCHFCLEADLKSWVNLIVNNCSLKFQRYMKWSSILD